MTMTSRNRVVTVIAATLVLGAGIVYGYASRRGSESPRQSETHPEQSKPPAASRITPPPPTHMHLRIGFSFSKPPYVAPGQFADIDPYSASHAALGFEVDILQAALAATGYTYKPSFQSFARIIADLDDGNLDAAETSGPPRPGLFYSRPIISCQNYAISRKPENLIINSIGDLARLRCVAWQGAATDLGPSFTAMAKENPGYYENTNQQSQYQMFADGKVDVIVIDKYIFQWWRAKDAKASPHEELVYHPIFPGVNPYFIGFREKSVRDAFDEQLIRLQEIGDIDRIIARYIPEHTGTTPGASQAIPVIYGISRPPYIMEQERRGISIDLADECFRRMGVITRPTFGSNQRMDSEMAAGTAAIGVEMQKGASDLFYSVPFITYHAIVASRPSDQVQFRTWPDLKGLRVATWQTAQAALGQDFIATIPTYGKYTEFADQRELVLQWATGQFDAIIIDKTLLQWNLAALAKAMPNLPVLTTIQSDRIPDGAHLDWFVGFRSASMCQSFNLAFQAIRQDGTYDRILSRYTLEGSRP